MGILDIFGGGSGPAKALKLKAKATQKYGDALARQKALEQLAEMKIPEARAALLSRFTLNVDPQTTDREEKERVVDLLRGMGSEALESVKEFLVTTEQATSWGLQSLEHLVSQEEATTFAVSLLDKLGSNYSRTPDKKVVLLQYVEERNDPRIAEVALPMLEDHSDDVKIAALKVLGPRQHAPARAKILELLAAEETGRRVQQAALSALAESEFSIEEQREQVTPRISEPFYVDASGVLKRRS